MENKNSENNIPAQVAAIRLGVSVEELEKLRRQGILHSASLSDEAVVYSARKIASLKSNRDPPLSEEAAKIGIQIQRQTVSSLSFIRKLVLAAGGGFLGFFLLVAVFTILFSLFPLQTANWLGLISKAPENLALQQDSQAKGVYVLGAQTDALPVAKPSLLQTALSPVRAVSLNIVKFANPEAYSQIAKQTILDTNDILGVDSSGSITPLWPLKIPSSSSLVISTPELVTNLNSQYLQGKKPGTNVGDIAVIGPNGLVNGLASSATAANGAPAQTLNGDATINGSGVLTLKGVGSAGTYGSASQIPVLTTDPQGRVLGVTNTTISGLSSSNLSALAGITNTQLNNSAVTINTTGPLSGGSSLSLGNSLTLSCPTCLISGGGLLTLAATSGSNSSIAQGGTLTLAAGSNITASNNAAGTVTIATSATPTFSTVNGLTLAAGSDGFSIAGGTTSRTATISGADITIGSTIKPSSTGALSIMSNGANILTLDAGGASTINIGTTNTSALVLGRSSITTTIGGIADANTLKIGSGTTILKHLSATATFDAANFSDCTTLATVTVTGAAVGDTALATPTPVAGGVETRDVSWNAYVSSVNTVTIRGCAVKTPENPANQTWRVDVWQH